MVLDVTRWLPEHPGGSKIIPAQVHWPCKVSNEQQQHAPLSIMSLGCATIALSTNLWLADLHGFLKLLALQTWMITPDVCS
jgi:cytochrome b involved in lipid metabolism